MSCRATCCVKGCRNRKQNKKLSFFKLPINKERCKLWLNTVGRPDLLQRDDLKPDCHFVCSAHFDESMVIYKPLLKPNAVPTKLLPQFSKDDGIPRARTGKSQGTQTDEVETSEVHENEINPHVELTVEHILLRAETEDVDNKLNPEVPVAGIPVTEVAAMEVPHIEIAETEPPRKRFYCENESNTG